jgi:hypothetical protein
MQVVCHATRCTRTLCSRMSVAVGTSQVTARKLMTCTRRRRHMRCGISFLAVVGHACSDVAIQRHTCLQHGAGHACRGDPPAGERESDQCVLRRVQVSHVHRPPAHLTIFDTDKDYFASVEACEALASLGFCADAMAHTRSHTRARRWPSSSTTLPPRPSHVPSS